MRDVPVRMKSVGGFGVRAAGGAGFLGNSCLAGMPPTCAGFIGDRIWKTDDPAPTGTYEGPLKGIPCVIASRDPGGPWRVGDASHPP